MVGARSKEYDVFFATPFSDSSTSTSASASAGTSTGAGAAPTTSSSLIATSQQTSGGLNGVATFVKKGRTVRASARELDGGVCDGCVTRRCLC